jgi:hypothetical protein
MANIVTNAWDMIARSRTALAKQDEKTTDNDLRNTSIFLGGLAIVGVAALMAWAGRTQAFAFGLLVMGGAGLVGGILGLLFGIPKSVSDPASVPPATVRSSDAAFSSGIDAEQRSRYTVNTNLEQISDWLTKIIVGVGLTQIATIRDHLEKLAGYFGKGFVTGTPPTASVAEPVVAAAIILYGATGGFLAGYLFTRIFLPGAFDRVDNELKKRNRELRTKITEVRESTEAAGRMQGEIYGDLYRYKEEGFRDAIRKIESLLESPENRRNPALWAYLAAAHGQAYRWELGKGPAAGPEKEQILKHHRDQAFNAVKTALLLGDDWKPILQLMWDKQHPVKVKEELGKEEDDLEVFYDDKAFKDILGG